MHPGAGRADRVTNKARQARVESQSPPRLLSAVALTGAVANQSSGLPRRAVSYHFSPKCLFSVDTANAIGPAALCGGPWRPMARPSESRWLRWQVQKGDTGQHSAVIAPSPRASPLLFGVALANVGERPASLACSILLQLQSRLTGSAVWIHPSSPPNEPSDCVRDPLHPPLAGLGQVLGPQHGEQVAGGPCGSHWLNPSQCSSVCASERWADSAGAYHVTLFCMQHPHPFRALSLLDLITPKPA